MGRYVTLSRKHIRRMIHETPKDLKRHVPSTTTEAGKEGSFAPLQDA